MAVRVPSSKCFLACTTCTAVLCLGLVSLLHEWSPRLVVQQLLPAARRLGRASTEPPVKAADRPREAEYARRVQRLRSACERLRPAGPKRVVASNRRFGQATYCSARQCPIVVVEQRRLLFCFIPKVASTSLKRLLLNASDIVVDESLWRHSTAFHAEANRRLTRVSTAFYATDSARARFFKAVFVRHPFDRLVSAFRSKAEGLPEDVWSFNRSYWIPIMRRLRPEGAPLDRITFKEFVWHVTHTRVGALNDHWAPYHSRCDPCLVGYDFVGKIETADQDYDYAFGRVGVGWAMQLLGSGRPTSRALTLKYFSTIPEEDVRRLYEIFRMDFELFGYSLEGFLPRNASFG